MGTGTSMEATAAAHHSGPIEPAARTPPVPAAAAPRARITSFFSGSSPPTGTGTGTATPAVAQTPTTGTSTGEAQKALAEAPNDSATGPETPTAAPESPATTTPTSGETMPPGESHEWLDNDGEDRFTESKIPLPHPLVNTHPVIWPSMFALDSNRRPVITHPAAGVLCMVTITGSTLDTTHHYQSTPGDDIFEGQKVITGACFHPCCTVYDMIVK